MVGAVALLLRRPSCRVQGQLYLLVALKMMDFQQHLKTRFSIQCGSDNISEFSLHHVLCFVDRVSLYTLFQMKPTRCTQLLSIFILTSLHVSGNYVPIIRRTYCVYATLVFFTLHGWLS